MIRKRIVGLLLVVILSMGLLQMPVNAIVFTDVLQSDYYYYAVYWAYDEGVTAGTGPTTFSPNNSLTRAQVVTFLWKLAGSPAGYQSYADQFTDISPDAYYRKAVGWAVYYNITSGTGNGHFSPNGIVTNKETIAFMYKAELCGQLPAKPTILLESVNLNATQSDWYYSSANWANTQGYFASVPDFANGFLPNAVTTRGLCIYLLWEMNTGQCDIHYASIITPSNVTVEGLKYTGGSYNAVHPNVSQYTGVIWKACSSKHYNCHGFAWYFCGVTTGIANEKAFGLRKHDGVNKIVTTGCYEEITFDEEVYIDNLLKPGILSELRPGDILVYLHGDGADYSPGEDYKHSVMIRCITTIGSSPQIKVWSKWGEYAVYEHAHNNCPYKTTEYTSPENPHEEDHFCKVKVFRNSHYDDTNTIKTDNSVVPVLSNRVIYTFSRYYNYDVSRHKKLCNCGRSYILENHNYVLYGSGLYRCTICGYNYYVVDPDNASDGEE